MGIRFNSHKLWELDLISTKRENLKSHFKFIPLLEYSTNNRISLENSTFFRIYSSLFLLNIVLEYSKVVGIAQSTNKNSIKR
jgi:hypothetical protein